MVAEPFCVTHNGIVFVWRDHEDTVDGTPVTFKDPVDMPSFIPMQFTGLKDKQGREIYEGDILRFDPKVWGQGNHHNLFAIEWAKQAAGFIGHGVAADWPRYCEVIGNIYENPELLK